MRIGISGGTFDPVHQGHISCALAARDSLKLEKVFFVPGGEPPHKLDRRITPAADRLAMLELALRPYEGLEVSDYETRKEAYSYSIDTVRHFIRQYGPDTEIYYIIGADVLGELEHWKDYSELFRLCRFAVFMRPGCAEDKFRGDLARYQQKGAMLCPVSASEVPISSAQIREAYFNGTEADVRGSIPAAVAAYIQEKALYRQSLPFEEAYAVRNMEIRLSPQRFRHAERVAEEARRIGTDFGVDPEKCRLAGLFHDCGKGVTEHQLYWLAPELADLGRAEQGGNPAIVHGPAGAVIAHKKYGIIDAEILEAIRCHVTGSPEMGPVAQAVFLADYTEPGREGASFDRIRQALQRAARCPEGLYGPVTAACEESIRYVIGKGEILSPQTIYTRNRFLIRKKEAEDGSQRNG